MVLGAKYDVQLTYTGTESITITYPPSAVIAEAAAYFFQISSIEKTTSSAVIGLPSWNFTSWRSFLTRAAGSETRTRAGLFRWSMG